MQKKQRRKLLQMAKYSRYRSFWRKLVRVMACIVVFCTTYALILPAITMDQTWYCGFEAHTHSEACWKETSVVEFSCQPEAGVLHRCMEDCLDAEGNRICPWQENLPHTHDDGCFAEVGHAHSDACYDTAGALACGIAETTVTRELICTKIEQQPHSHGEGCQNEAGERICLLPELTEHIHSEACRSVTVNRELVCTLPEHEHTDLCSPDPNFDLEEAADWEKTFAHLTLTGQWRQDVEAMAKSQIGYTESLRNYTVDAHGSRKGYTRYGQWYGSPYGSWDALFVGFCIHYSGIPGDYMPPMANSSLWMEQLQGKGLLTMPGETVPAAGDLLFYRDENGQTRTAIVTEAASADGTLSYIRAVAGDVEGRVDQIHLEPGQLLGLCDLEYAQQNQPPAMISLEAETENYTVTVAYPEDLILPEGAQLRVTEYPKDSEIYLQRCAEAGYALEWLLNIGFFVGEEELNLEGQFQVAVSNKSGQPLDTQVTHFADSGVEQLEGSPEENGSVSFSSDGFSDFGGAIRAAEDATVTLNFTSWSDYNPVSFPTGNKYTAPVGSTFTVKLSDNNGGSYRAPVISLTGGELVSHSYSCGTAGCSHNWCSTNPLHTFVFRITGKNMQVNVRTEGSDWNQSTVTLSADSGGGTVPEPTDPVNPGTTPDPSYPYYPHAVHTGEVSISRLRFYNLAENGDNGVKPLPGCVFEVTGPGGYSATVTSTNDVEVLLPTDIPDGTYTIKEIYVPDGYMRDTEYERTFEVKNGALTSNNNIGTFVNHDLHQLNSDKTAEVEDYNNRIYQVLLSAESHMRLYEMGPVDVLFVVDQSNSMLFPASLNPTGKSVQLRLDGNGNVERMNDLGLDKNQMYYLISDPQGTSTVWCIWYNGQTWMYQDASYYAKAKHGNVPGYQAPNGEIAIFPQNRSYKAQADAEAANERSNGGGLGHSLSGSGLGKDIDKFTGDVQTYALYTSPTEFNRLHYLEEALSNMIYELADANEKNRVTLTRFTKEVKPTDDIGPLELTPDNAEILVNAVRSINTDGGTRQDIALAHVYNNHLNDASENFNGGQDYTYTILITDGAPVISSGSSIDNLGSANDAASTTANSVYAQIKGYAAQVRTKSSLMTVGLGLDSMEAGRQVLNEIATNNEYYCAMEDASQLVHNLQRLLFDTFKPKEAIEITADVTDEISDSFYPIAWVTPGTDSGRQFLVNSTGRDWILPVVGDWLTLDGGLTTAEAANAAGQLLQKADGTFYIHWKNVQISDPNWHYDNDRIAWVAQGTGASTGKTVIATYGGKDWIQLNEGDWINQQGEYYPGTPSYFQRRYYGQIARTGDEYFVNWGSGTDSNERERFVSEFGWHGTFYVKAKEDFIGGNAIHTNKRAWITTEETSKSYPKPTVNVRLLGLNELHSKVTVFLGDTVNEPGHSPLDSIQEFYEQLRFTKLISDGGSILNRVTADSAEGLENAVFYLRYAMGRDITVDEWNTLLTGGTITIPYAYDYPSNHGDVGQFTVTLHKTAVPGAQSSWSEHTATVACQPMGTPTTEHCDTPVETYVLDIVYTAYRLGEKGRPEKNVYNDANGPGTEVGTGTNLPNGAGTVTSHNVHEVHVISGAIEIAKVFADGITDTEDRTFAFVLHRLEDGESTAKDVTKSITIPAGQTKGTASVYFDNLPRGTYTVTEAVDEKYTVKDILVTTDTNCYSIPVPGSKAGSVTFTLGHDLLNENVIARVSQTDAYTSYVHHGYGVYGEAVFTNGNVVYYGEIPVKKIWVDDSTPNTDDDAVYVVLCKDGLPVLDSDGNARILRLNATSGWEGTFRVILESKTDNVSDGNYSIREAKDISAGIKDDWKPALLENDGVSLLYYEALAAEGSLIAVNNKGYVVQYEKDADGTFLVRNLRSIELPSTGGIGTHKHTVGGLLLLALALLYGCSLRRKRKRREYG